MAETGTSHFDPTGGNDTIAWSKWLTEHKVPKAQADAHAQLIAKAVGQSAASKEDLRNTELKLQNEIQRVESDLMSEIKRVESDVKELISDKSTELLKWMIGMFLGLAGLMIGLIKFL